MYGDAHASLRSLNGASESLRKGLPLMVFPEGGRAETGSSAVHGRRVLRGHPGQVPVVPIAIVGTYELLPMNSFHVLPGRWR